MFIFLEWMVLSFPVWRMPGVGQVEGEMRSSVLCILGVRGQPKAVAYVSLMFRTVCSSSITWIVAEATGMEIIQAEEELIKRVMGEMEE